MANVSKQERKAIHERRKQKQRQKRLSIVLIISTVAILIVGLAFLPTLLETLQPVGEIIIPEEHPRELADFNAQGDPNAPVVIIEYSDYQCPYCKRHSDETEPLIEQNHVATGEVYLIHRSMGNYISDNIRRGKTESIDSAEAAYCAGDQGKFWEYKDILFANWLGEDVGSYSEKRLMAMAEAINLNIEEFRSCFQDHKYRERALQDRQDASLDGINVSPAFLINGEIVTGAESYSVFAQKIQEALIAAGNQ